jgi:hypothetical protein
MLMLAIPPQPLRQGDAGAVPAGVAATVGGGGMTLTINTAEVDSAKNGCYA